jgi:hypothetical protein
MLGNGNTTGPRRMTQRIIGLLLTFAASASLVLLGAPSANASAYAHEGVIGLYSTDAVACKWRIHGVSSTLVMTAQPPRVWAADTASGSGNDASWVRYNAYVVDASTGTTLGEGTYSGWVVATDQTPATWAGETTFVQPFNGNYYVDYRIEFWSAVALTGWVAERHGSYLYYDQYNRGPIGPLSSCARTVY